jgi:Tol biopolymer transport system component
MEASSGGRFVSHSLEGVVGRMSEGNNYSWRQWSVPGLWCLHSYYTVCPYAPDKSGRLLVSGVDVESGEGEVFVLSNEGEVLHRFGRQPVANTGFYHTGFWQTWSPDARYVYYQSGSWDSPRIVRHELATGEATQLEGDMQGAPPYGEPIISGLLGMLYASGTGGGKFRPELSPMPFLERDRHGLFQFEFATKSSELILSVTRMLEIHPQRDRLLAEDQTLKRRLGPQDGLTLMIYCVRWSPSGDRLLFYFGNHQVDPARGEPRLSYVMTADRDLNVLHLALDLSFGKPGLHWSWHPDGEQLIGYGPDPDHEGKLCLAMVRYDGTGYRKVSSHDSGGHPSVSPIDWHLVVTDSYGEVGELCLIDIRNDTIIRRISLPRTYRDNAPKGRNEFWVDLHPIFSRDGKKILVNTMKGECSVLIELDVDAEILPPSAIPL